MISAQPKVRLGGAFAPALVRQRRGGAFVELFGGVAPPTVLTDSFDRVNDATTLGVAETGETWQYWGGTWGIESNNARLYSTSPAATGGTINRVAYLDTGCADGVLQVTLATIATGNRIAFRATDDVNLLWVFPNAAGYELWKTEAASSVPLVKTTVVPAAGDVVTIGFTGALIVVRINGVTILTWASSFNRTATRHGLLAISVNTGRFGGWSFTSDTSTIGVTDPNSVTATHALAPLTVPTYEGSGQLVHPDVLDMEQEIGPGQVWNGFRYWMAFTPYPFSNDIYENPCILASADGDTWVLPSGATNPITPLPEGADYHSDPDLILSQDGSRLYCFYRRTGGGATTLYRKSSTDGVTWSSETTVYVMVGTELAPSIVWDGTQYRIYISRGTATGFLYRTLADLDATVVSELVACAVAGITPRNYWHSNVIRTPTGEYQAVFQTYPIPGALRFGLSADGVSWAVADTPFLEVDAGLSWVDRDIYRSSLVRTGPSTWDLWYPGQSAAGAWRLGRTTMRVA